MPRVQPQIRNGVVYFGHAERFQGSLAMSFLPMEREKIMKVKLVLSDRSTATINAQGPSWAEILKMQRELQRSTQKNGHNL
jgi:hypothetical protein